jgi:hypothetical protein
MLKIEKEWETFTQQPYALILKVNKNVQAGIIVNIHTLESSSSIIKQTIKRSFALTIQSL